MANGFLESNIEELRINQWLALSRIMGGWEVQMKWRKQRPGASW